MTIVGDKVRLSETGMDHLSQVIALEQDNQTFIGSFDREGHMGIIKDPNSLHLSIFDIEKGQFVGFILLDHIQSPHRHIEFKRIAIGIKRRGFGREAIRLMKKLCFEELHAHSLWLDVFDDNHKAISLYESEGFVFEGLKRECYLDQSGYRSQRFYSMLETEYTTTT